MSDLIPIESVNAIEVFTGNGLDDLLARIRAEAITLVPDLSTATSRKDIASQAYKVARSKTAIDEAGKALVADLKKQTGDIDAARKKARDTLDALRDEVRKPLTDWEAEQERIERERVEAEERAKAEAEAKRLADLERREAELRAKEEAIRAAEEAERQRAAAEQAEKARVEREAQLQRDAEERAKREGQEAIERAEREAAAAKEQAARDAAAAEAREKAAAERAQRDKEEAVRQAEQKAQREAEQREQDRLAAEAKAAAEGQRRREDEARLAANKAHRRRINIAAVEALTAGGIDAEAAKAVVTLIALGKVPAVVIQY